MHTKSFRPTVDPMVIPRRYSVLHLPILGLALAVALWCEPAAGAPPAELVEKLNDSDYQKRESAQAALLEWARANPESCRIQLRQLMTESTQPEQRLRSLEVLRSLHADSYRKQGKGFIGITMFEVQMEVPGRKGAQPAIRVTMVLPGHSAQQAGIQVGDCIVALNDQWLEVPAGAPKVDPAAQVMQLTPTLDAFRSKVSDMKPGTSIKLGILRDGKVLQLEVTLGRRPAVADNPGFQLDPQGAEQLEKQAIDEDFRRWLEKDAGKGD